jgi:hypothetical protein
VRKRTAPVQTVLLKTPDAVELIRFEKNLLQIGFFGSHERRDKNAPLSRRFEQWVNRDGKKVKVSAEFRSNELGLPTTADRDKFMAFSKLAMEQKIRNGVITNPIRFSGYSLLSAMELCDSGENYEALNTWGMRMAGTTITSEEIMYSAARRKYMNKTVNVFRSFTRLGSSDHDGSKRTDQFEIVLEDWLLENLNDSFVIPEDFNMYRKLKRPTAKGIFVYLYLWFYATKGKPVEKDYIELCSLLNIRSYEYVSKIKETIGVALSDLVEIGYLKSWDVKPMSSMDRYKLILVPGRAIKEILEMTQRKQLAFASEQMGETLALDQQEAKAAMIALGLSEAKAGELARKHDSAFLLDRIDYVTHQVESSRVGSFKNPPGYFISFVEGQQKIPDNFLTRRRRQSLEKQRLEQDAARQDESLRTLQEMEAQEDYEAWRHSQAEDFISHNLSAEKLDKKLKEIASELRMNPTMAKTLNFMKPEARRSELMRYLRREIIGELELPSFEEWKGANVQPGLFTNRL